eukprot:10150657-Prorocentrum_lima.AAC.1
MTSSLVGSEMCIRDSFGGIQVPSCRQGDRSLRSSKMECWCTHVSLRPLPLPLGLLWMQSQYPH